MNYKAMANHLMFSFLLSIFFYDSGLAIKCFHCNSANNSACLDLNLQKYNAVVPVVDCARSIPSSVSKSFFCRKIEQTILHIDRTPEVRITRGCGWMKHPRECYTNEDKDHLEVVCQCFGDMCNAGTMLNSFGVTTLTILSAILMMYRSWREKI